FASRNIGRTSDPIPRFEEFHILLFDRARIWLEIVDPAHQRWQAHQYGLGPSPCFQTEEGSSVVKKIEFDIAAAPVKLKLTLLLRVSFRQATPGDRQVRVQKGVAKFADKREILFTIAFHVIE